LQTWNRTAEKPVQVLGVDVQDAGRDLDYALSTLAQHDPAQATALRKQFAAFLSDQAMSQHMVRTIQGLTHAEWKAAWLAVQTLDADLVLAADHTPAEIARARSATAAARAGLEMFEYDSSDADAATMPDTYYGIRDLAMADRLLQALPAGARAVFWAHDGHVARDDAAIGFDAVSVGTRLNEVLGPRAYKVVNFTYQHAQLHAINFKSTSKTPTGGESAPEVWSIDAEPDALGALTAKAGPKNYWVSLDNLPAEPWVWGWRNIPYQRLSFGWGFSNDDISLYDFPRGIRFGFDILVHIQQLTPSERLPVPPTAPSARSASST
jgi:erythromycin esterase-like protein